MDMNESAKQKVLQQLIDIMDSKSVEDMKAKSPKFMKVETNDPEMAKQVVKNATENAIPDESEEPMESEMPMESDMHGKSEMPMESDDDEDMKRLMEIYKQLK